MGRLNFPDGFKTSPGDKRGGDVAGMFEIKESDMMELAESHNCTDSA